MSRILILSSGGAGMAAASICARQPDVFSSIVFANRRSEPCRRAAESVQAHTGRQIETRQVNADNVGELRVLLHELRPDILLNLSLPHQNLTIMDACLQECVPYLDTTVYKPLDGGKPGYARQWAFHNRYRDAGVCAILGCGLVPGVASAFCTYVQDQLLDEIHAVDILSCTHQCNARLPALGIDLNTDLNGFTRPARYWEAGLWKESRPLTESRVFNYPGVGPRNSFLLAHEAEESLAKHMRGLQRIRYWRTFTGEQLARMNVLQHLGLTRTDPVMYEGNPVVPLQFLKVLLPESSDPAVPCEGQTCTVCLFGGVKDKQDKTCLVSCSFDHKIGIRDAGVQAGDYMNGAAAATGARLFLQGVWGGIGVYNVEELDPEPFMAELPGLGLSWQMAWLDEPPAGFACL